MKSLERITSIILAIMMVVSLAPITVSAEATSGTCGDNLTWTYNDTNCTLTILGEGEMYGYDNNNRPWESYEDNIKTVVIEDGVTSIGKHALYSFGSLTSITIPDSVTLIGYAAFSYCPSLTNITIPTGVTLIDERTFYKCTSLASVAIPNSVTSIGWAAFYNCTSLASVTIPDSVTSIGYAAFSHCTNLASITIPDSVTSIDNHAFSDCTSLKSVSIGNCVTKIGTYVFYNCTSLTSITIPNGVTSIGGYVFSNCTSLESITIPDSITTIWGCAFSGCTSLTDVYYIGTEEQWNNITIFSGNTCLTNATIYYNSIGLGPGNSSCNIYGHSYNAVVIPPNYTIDGYTTYTCSLCGDTYIADYMPMTGLSSVDIFDFDNSDTYFDTGTYTVKDEHFEKLCDCVETHSTSYENAQSTINMLQKERSEVWVGSCYGMSTTVLLDKLNMISFNENFSSNASTMHEVCFDDDNNVMSAINYYQFSQLISFVNEKSISVNKLYKRWSSELEHIVDLAESGKLFLFEYFWFEGLSIHGHTLVVTGYKELNNGNYILYAYDCRYPKQSVEINIDEDYKLCFVSYINYLGEYTEEEAFHIKYTTDFSGLDKVDIDGPENQINYFNSGVASSNSNTTIYFPATGDITIQNENGETLTYSEGVVSGTMETLSIEMITGSPAEIAVEVLSGKSFEVTSTSDDIDISFLTEKTFASATVKNANRIVFDENNGVYAFGENVSYDISLTSNMSNTDMISINGESVGDVSLAYEDGAIVAKGVDGADCLVTVFSDTVNVEDKCFKPSHSSIMIASLSEEYGDVDILASSNEDDVYDISIMTNIEDSFSIQEPSTTTIRHKDGIILRANVEGNAPAGSYVKWESSNGNFSTSADGSNLKIIAKNKGWTTFTAILCDADGNELARDSVEMYSKSGLFDKIGGFFRSLFGTTKVYEE